MRVTQTSDATNRVASMATADEDDLLRQVEIIQSSADASAHDDALRTIEPFVSEMARRVCCFRRASRQLSRDFVDGSLSSIFGPRGESAGDAAPRIARYRPSDGPFAGWLWTALDHLLVDEMRAAARRNKHELASAALNATRSSGYDAGFASDQATSEPFSAKDLEKIGAWRPLDRIRLLSVARLWRKVPADTWAAWCSEVDLLLEFAPLHQEEQPLEHWLASVADAMQESRAAFRQHWYRKRKLLEELDYVREIRDEG